MNFKSIVLRGQKAVGAQILTRFQAFGLFWRSNVDFGKSYVDFWILVSFSIPINKFLIFYRIFRRNRTENAIKPSDSGQKIISLTFLSVSEPFRISLLLFWLSKRCWIIANTRWNGVLREAIERQWARPLKGEFTSFSNFCAETYFGWYFWSLGWV